jgi:hypothetical protein
MTPHGKRRTPLTERMAEDMLVRNLSPRTIDSYTYHVDRFVRHFARPAEALGPEEIRQYQLHLIKDRKVGWSSFNQAVCALRFLYRFTIAREWHVKMIPFGKRPKKLPVVLGQEQAAELIRCVANLKHRTVELQQRAGQAVALPHGGYSNRRRTTYLHRCRELLRLTPLSTDARSETPSPADGDSSTPRCQAPPSRILTRSSKLNEVRDGVPRPWPFSESPFQVIKPPRCLSLRLPHGRLSSYQRQEWNRAYRSWGAVSSSHPQGDPGRKPHRSPGNR